MRSAWIWSNATAGGTEEPGKIRRAILYITPEIIARMAFETVTINPIAASIPDEMGDKHFLRKHGPKASYGQAG